VQSGSDDHQYKIYRYPQALRVRPGVTEPFGIQKGPSESAGVNDLSPICETCELARWPIMALGRDANARWIRAKESEDAAARLDTTLNNHDDES
jgi:hypothetical protein